jgi:hypothetical protein
MKTKLLSLLSVGVVLSVSLFAQEKSADELIKSMKKEEISYRQLMNGMAMAHENITTGVVSMNKLLVDRGINFIRTHPAPRAKPWTTMAKEDRDGFKSMLVYYDKKMDDDIDAIEKAVNLKDWMGAVKASSKLSNSCISCHVVYKDKVKYIMK